MKTKKLNLNDLKVESFVTSLEGKDAQTVKGGTGLSDPLRFAVATAAFVIISIAVSVVVEAVDDADAKLEGKKEEKKEECKK